MIEEKWYLKNPYTSAYGAARSLLALGTFLTLAFNSPSHLFFEAEPACDTLHISIFCLLKEQVVVARWICYVLLLVVISGWRPRYTAVLHWWVSFSLSASAVTIDGGDHITTIITCMLIPICITDSRKLHWRSDTNVAYSQFSPKQITRYVTASVSLIAIKIQISFIYLHAAVSKVSVAEWLNGTALYYWFTHPIFGATKPIQSVLLPLISHGFMSAYLTWAVILFEFMMFAGLFMDSRYKRFFLFSGIAFHLGILVIHGLFTFFLTMSGVLILYFCPEKNFDWSWIHQRFSAIINFFSAKTTINSKQ